MSDEHILQKAKALIQQKQYAQARKLLHGIPNNPTARKWLAKLDEIAPPPKQTGGSILTIGLAVIFLLVLIGGTFAVFSMLNGEDVESTSEPAVVALATSTSTSTSEPTATATVTST